MTPRHVRLALLLATPALAALALPASAATFSGSVSADANIFGAGGTPGQPGPAPTPPDSGPGVNPPDFHFTLGTDRVLTFSSVTGEIIASFPTASGGGFTGGQPNGPAGGPNFTPINIAPFGNLSGIQSNDRNSFLAGVFRNDANSGPTPPTLSYDAAARNQPAYSPALNQIFYVGAGQTSAGLTQQFNVPAGATHLYLGIPDEFFDLNNPASFIPPGPVTPFGAYFDNTGNFQVSFTISNADAIEPIPPIPEPSPLAALAMAALAIPLRFRLIRRM